jgi:MOSC domain-containing protein YiiM
MEFRELFSNFAQAGTVTFIGLRPERLAAMQNVLQAEAIQDVGLKGDRYRNKGGARQVTLIQAEHLLAIASLLGREKIDPEITRRNIVVKGINLRALKSMQFKVGEAIFEYSGECHPCSRMEQSLGTGGYNAMRGHGGITAKVIETGVIRVGDPVFPIIGK